MMSLQKIIDFLMIPMISGEMISDDFLRTPTVIEFKTMPWTQKKTSLVALEGEVKHVADGAKDVRLIDEKHAQSSAPDQLIKIKDTPDAVVSEILEFHSNNPGPGERATASCPVPGCRTSIVINKKKPAPGVTPLPPCLTDGLTPSTSP
jgi:hypothetical protein